MLSNNSSQGFFRPSWGIRQGDPLSPYVFVLCINVFVNALCDLANNTKSGLGFGLPQELPPFPAYFSLMTTFYFVKPI